MIPRVSSVILSLASTLLLVSACGPSMPAIRTVDEVDLDRFMGDWYVIANIPTSLEEGAHNAVESYARGEDAEVIETTFTFREDGFDGPRKTYHPTGYVRDDSSNAIWGMQFIWPFKSDYRIIWLDETYDVTVIGRQARDYVWVMAREPSIDPMLLDEIRVYLTEQGYDISQLQMVPQRWEEQRKP